ncbi:MAG: hypothetical protein HQK51_14830 [Oligoflexia bacterium]|nr:hypothetical protein [Oligoflexia bacterium]
MNNFFKVLLIFLALTGAITIISEYSNMPFGYRDFWEYRGYLGGIFFLFFIALFPRLTLFVSSVPFGGVLWWIGWFFMPRILVASLATVTYWNHNKILVIISWLVALGGESSEKVLISRRPRMRFFFRSNNLNFGRFGRSKYSSHSNHSSHPQKIDDSNTIETEFRKL